MKIKSTLKKLSSLISHLSSQKGFIHAPFFRKNGAGFTLVELLIVIGILGILASVVLAAIDPIKKLGQAKDATIKVQINQIANAMRVYYTAKAITGAASYPNTVAALVTANELQSEPKLPGNVAYSMWKGPSGCGSACLVVAVYATLNVPEGDKTVWCWRSDAAGKIEAMTPTVCQNDGDLQADNVTGMDLVAP